MCAAPMAKMLLFLLMCVYPQTTATSCVLPVVTTEYNFQLNVTEISGSPSLIRVKCLADPDTDVTSYVWQKNGENIEEPSLFSSFLTLRDLSVEDGGLYRCEVATAGCGNRYSTEISINTPPGNVVISGPALVAVGHSFQLTCSANGWPPPDYTWSLGGEPVAVGGMYGVSSAEPSDAGEYTCVAHNSQGQVEDSLTLTLSVSPTSVEAVSSVAKVTSEETAKLSMSSHSTAAGKMSTTRTEAESTRHKVPATTESVSQTPGFSENDGGRAKESTGNPPTAPFIALLTVAIALLLALVGVLITAFMLMIWVMKSSSSHEKDDRERLVEEEEGERMMEVEEGDPDNQTNELDKSPTSCVNIAFEQDPDDEDEEEEEEEEEFAMLISGDRSEGALLKISPQRYQQQQGSELRAVSGKWPRPSSSPSAVPPSVSMDMPRQRGRREGEAGPTRVSAGATPSTRSLGDPARMSHPTPSPDTHKLNHQKKHRSQGIHTENVQMQSLSSDSEKVQLLAAMEGDGGGEVHQEELNGTVPTVLLSVEEMIEPVDGKLLTERREEEEEEGGKEEEEEEREEEESGKEEEEEEKVEEGETLGEKDEWVMDEIEVSEARGGGEEDSEEEEITGATFIDEAEEEATSEEREMTTESAIIIQEKTGEVTVTFKQLQEENTGVLLGEGSATFLPHGSSRDEEGGGREGEGEGEREKGEEVERETVVSDERAPVPEDVATKEASTGGGAQGRDTEDPDIHKMSVFVEKARKMGRTPLIAELDRSHPLTVEELEDLVEEALAGVKGNRLTLEYKTVPHNSVKSLPLSVEEKRKNRYRNVLPNPCSAVRLSDTGVPGSQYINANYIRGYGDKESQYIATQGPTASTLADFWRMVWEKDVSIIVMTTSLVENGSQKCIKYWPGADDRDTMVYGNMVVRNNYEEVTNSYTTSYLSIYPQSPDGREMGEERDIYHFWHTAWCDFGVPRETGSTLRLREAVDAFRVPSSGPVLVHCSAGLGRSGTFMAIDMGIQQYEAEGVVDPLRYMCEMREDRGGIIQTADQYVYIHRALRDFITT